MSVRQRQEIQEMPRRESMSQRDRGETANQRIGRSEAMRFHDLAQYTVETWNMAQANASELALALAHFGSDNALEMWLSTRPMTHQR